MKAKNQTETISAADLLKMATEKRDAGNIFAAIDLLRKAYAEIGNDFVSYPVSTFLRLPLYLQQAGHNEEAWREFNLLLTRGFQKQFKNPELLPMEHYQIYDKMRLFLQREKKFDLAVHFGILSYISWAIGLFHQNRVDELKGYIEDENIESNIIPLLKKAKKLNLKDELVAVVVAEIKLLPNVDFANLTNHVDAVIFR